MKNSLEMEKKLAKLCEEGVLDSRTERNSYLKYSYKGAGTLVSPKWNIKVYTSGKIVCNDMAILDGLLKDKLKTPDLHLKLLEIDDAGIGFPLCGVMVGVSDGVRIWTDTVDAQLFQGDAYGRRLYLKDYTERGLGIIDEIGATPGTHRIEICSGFINTELKDALRSRGFDVRIVEIKGLLQANLERKFKEHVMEVTGADLAYDPKEVRKADVHHYFDLAVLWGRQNAPHLIKTGWKCFRDDPLLVP